VVKYERPPLATSRARTMRHAMTDAERKLWFLLRDRRLNGAKFRRQAPVGSYIADFVCLRDKLIVEADGGQHIESRRDAARDRWLAAEGYRVIRYSNLDILKNPDGVLTDLLIHLEDRG
jgi:very-short-patch-repair endonuclease